MREMRIFGWMPDWKAGFAVRLGTALALLLIPGAAMAGEPCCGITAIQLKTGVVSAQDKTGRKFQFKVEEAALLKSLKVGQKIYADFATQKVSVDGVSPCCAIIQGATLGTTNATGANSAKDKISKGEPCCNLTAIDRATGIVSARNQVSGQVVSFKVNHAGFLAGLRVGQLVDLANIGGNRVVVRTETAEVEAVRIN